jgi:hypothetical protein
MTNANQIHHKLDTFDSYEHPILHNISLRIDIKLLDYPIELILMYFILYCWKIFNLVLVDQSKLIHYPI